MMSDYIRDREKMLHILQDIAACRTFDEYDPKECTEEVYKWGKAIVDTARQAIIDVGMGLSDD